MNLKPPNLQLPKQVLIKIHNNIAKLPAFLRPKHFQTYS